MQKKRLYFTDFSGDFFIESDPNLGVKLVAGETVSITVIHTRPSTGDFNATLFGREV